MFPTLQCYVCGISMADHPIGECGFVDEDLCADCADAAVQPRGELFDAEVWRHRMAGMRRVLLSGGGGA